ncbi:dienelactone hydrolase family protein [Alloalcanivorax mobilis]|uniref:dienelactone hydrolase family protein n=1 Tax=Alloalcanivorax mobilis TaxID=2019569 RepID=UPI000C766AAB|nr:dienelactone hydrolase family protein [Alloalcanivorax mobilis]
MSEVINQPIEYQAGGKNYQGHLLYRQGARPDRGLLMAPNFFGISDAALAQAEKRLDDRSVILVLDPFGAEVRPSTPEQAMAAMGEARSDGGALRAVLRAAFEALRQRAGELGVSQDRLAVFGFCFGGACALEMARDGVDARAFVSFHGLLDSDQRATRAPAGPVLVLNGADDPMVSAEAQAAFKKEMDGADADWTLVNYGGAVHSFTDPGANTPGRSLYSPKVARRAFAAMDDLFEEVLG